MRFPKLPVPAAFPSDEPREQLCINHDWVIVMLSVMDRLRYPASWTNFGDPTQTESKVLELVKMLVEANAMGCGCGCGETTNPTRFNENGDLEVFDPVTGTWIPFPEGDPRQTATLLQPLPGADGDDKKCQGATNATAHLKDLADKLIADAGAWGNISQLVAALIGILIFVGIIGSGGALTPLLLALAGILLTTGQAAFTAAMTSVVYDTLNCILYCNIQPDATFTDANITAIKAAIDDQLTGIAHDFLRAQVVTLGKIGMSNAARTSNTRVFDCSTCNCDCAYSWSVWDGPNGNSPPGTYGIILEQETNRVRVEFTGNYITLVTDDINHCCRLVDAVQVGGTGAFYRTAYNDCGTAFSGGAFQHPVDPTNHVLWIFEFQALGADRPIVDIFFAKA